MIKKRLKQRKGESLILVLFMLFLLLIALIILVYLLYLNMPGEPQRFNEVFYKTQKLEIKNLSYGVQQFHPNMKFNHNNLSYYIEPSCSYEQEQRILKAFEILHNKTQIIDFYPTYINPDIEVSCSKKLKHSVKEDYFIAGEGGARAIIPTGRYNVITNGTILLYANNKNKKCDWPNIELHELLHVFGFAHSKNPESIMYPYLESCDQKLDFSIINLLKKLYSKRNYPDLYFSNVSAVKKGRYLDFNVTIKNSGTIKSPEVILRVYENNNSVKDFSISPMYYGAGVTLQIQNLKLNRRDFKEIKFVIDPENKIKELDKDNNLAILKL